MLRRPINTWVQWLEEARERVSHRLAIDAPIANQRRPSALPTSAFIIIYSPRACHHHCSIPLHRRPFFRNLSFPLGYHLPKRIRTIDDDRGNFSCWTRNRGTRIVVVRDIQLFRMNEMESCFKRSLIYICIYRCCKKKNIYIYRLYVLLNNGIIID